MQYINPQRHHEEIREKLTEILSTLNDVSDDKFFIILDRLSCLINIFFTQKTFSITDCCRTVDSIWELFQQNDDIRYQTKTVDELNMILYNEYNIFKFEVGGEFPFHTFILIRYNQQWYMIQSYTGICSATVTKDNMLPDFLGQLLETKSAFIYNLLFKTSLLDIQRNVSYIITVGQYNQLPLDAIIKLMQEYIK